jgi:hypothetical protein
MTILRPIHAHDPPNTPTAEGVQINRRIELYGNAPKCTMPASASFLSLSNRQKRLAASVTEVLDTIAGQEGEDGSVPETDAVSLTKADTQPSERTADTPIPAAPTSSGSVLPAAGADAEIARLQADIEDLRRENAMLWAQVRHEREARIREIELLGGMIQGMRR